MKIGILTFYNAHNYGAVLQAFALSHFLAQKATTEILKYDNPHISLQYLSCWNHLDSIGNNVKNIFLRRFLKIGFKRERKFNSFINELPLSHDINGLNDILNEFDILISGSDQVWNQKLTYDSTGLYFFKDVGTSLKKISYAASCGNYELTEDEIEYVKQLDSVGVREEKTQNLIKIKCKKDSVLTPDPTILLTADEWANIEEPYANLPLNYLLFYSVRQDLTNVMLPLIRQIANHLKLPIVYINYSRGIDSFLMNYKVDYNLTDVGPKEFIWLFHHASFIIPLSFHGNMFSIIFRKQFASLALNEKFDDRILSLHRSIGLGTSRLFTSFDEFKRIGKIINYDDIDSDIKNYKVNGINFLSNVIV